MYENFFGFSERPFNLVPNPQYLYLGASHKEVLAHLTYAVSTKEGFMAITGEVGTGKTTLCRAFLDNLNSSVEAAYIFNPNLDAIGLLQTINSEYGLEAASDDINRLITALNLFLMEKNRAGNQVILIIDEAQNLEKPVLEQLRLLSNLETHQSKLIQIILVGQPELENTLKSYDLRQLRQRIGMFWRLGALSADETHHYVRHRLGIASTTGDIVFDPRAFDLIYRYTTGVPRLINIICDRALIVAFGEGKTIITGKMVKNALREVGLQDKLPPKPITAKTKTAAALAGALFFLTGAAMLAAEKDPPDPGRFTTAAVQTQQTRPSRQSPPRAAQAAEKTPEALSPTDEPSSPSPADEPSPPSSADELTPASSANELTPPPSADEPSPPPSADVPSPPSSADEPSPPPSADEPSPPSSANVLTPPPLATLPEAAAATSAQNDSPSKIQPELTEDLDQAKTILRKRPLFKKPKPLSMPKAAPNTATAAIAPAKTKAPVRGKRVMPELPRLRLAVLTKVPDQYRKSNVKALFKAIDPQTNRSHAIRTAMQLWASKPTIQKKRISTPNDFVFFQHTAADNGLAVHAFFGDLEKLQQYNLPAVLELHPPHAARPWYVTLKHVHNNHLILSCGSPETDMVLALNDIAPYWSGAAYILWKPLLNTTGPVGPNARADTIAALKRLLGRLGFADLDPSSGYDRNTRAAVIELQKKYKLDPNGVVGVRTHIALYREWCAKQAAARRARLSPVVPAPYPNDVKHSFMQPWG